MRRISRFSSLFAVALGGIFVLVGCGVRYPKNYVLNFPPPTCGGSLPGRALGPLAVREFRSLDHLSEGRIVYRPSPEEVGFYEYHRWAVSPREAITQFMTETVRADSLFKSVTAYERGTEAAYVLSGKIEQLEEVDHGRDVGAVCTISAELRDVRSGQIVWSQTASATVPVEKRNVAGVVSSLSAAARATVDRLAHSMRAQLASGRAHQ